MKIPASFTQQISTVFDGGDQWLAQLPDLIADCTQRWSLTIGEPFVLSYNYVCAATQADGTPVVLKLGVPRGELTREIAALRLYDGRGIARLLDADVEQGALLLERLQPGDMLSTLADPDEAARVGAQVMRSLWQPLPEQHAFRSVKEWADGLGRLRSMYDGGTGPLPEGLVISAEFIFHDLFADAAPSVLLHGDFHHYNVLSANRGLHPEAPPELDEGPVEGWLAIDPKGMAGEPAFETGTFIRNHFGVYGQQHEPRQLLDRCIAILAETLNLDRQRIRQHAIAQAVLSAFWSLEGSGQGWEPAIQVAQLLTD